VPNVLKGHNGLVNSVAISEDGNCVRLTGAGLNVLKVHTNPVNSVVFSRDGMENGSGLMDGTVGCVDGCKAVCG